VQWIDTGDTRDDKAPIMLRNAVRECTMVDVRHHEAAEHEKHVDGQIALVDQMSVLRGVEIRETLHAVVIEHHPQSGNSAQRVSAGNCAFESGGVRLERARLSDELKAIAGPQEQLRFADSKFLC
jgi:hypothetical protein